MIRNTKEFKTKEQMLAWTDKNKKRYAFAIIFVANGYCVEYWEKVIVK